MRPHTTRSDPRSFLGGPTHWCGEAGGEERTRTVQRKADGDVTGDSQAGRKRPLFELVVEALGSTGREEKTQKPRVSQRRLPVSASLSASLRLQHTNTANPPQHPSIPASQHTLPDFPTRSHAPTGPREDGVMSSDATHHAGPLPGRGLMDAQNLPKKHPSQIPGGALSSSRYPYFANGARAEEGIMLWSFLSRN